MQGMHKVRLLSPAGTEQVSADSPSSAPMSGAPASIILLIDDSPTIRKVVEMCLRREGYAVVSFANGVDALRWLTYEARSIPALVLLDIGLPKVDGYEVARILKTQPAWRSIVIVMMSRRDGLVDRLKGRLAGAQAYLIKPFTTTQLLERVHACLDEKIEANRR